MTIQRIKTIIKVLRDIQVILLGSLGTMVIFTIIAAFQSVSTIIGLGLLMILINVLFMLIIGVNIHLLQIKIKRRRIGMCINKSIEI